MEAVSSRIFTIPNVLSMIRLAFIPVYFVLLLTGEYGWALVVVAGSAITDWVDGFIARRFHQVSRLGKILDPAADRLFILTTLLGLAGVGIVPWWLVALIVGRDLLLVLLGVVLANFGHGPLPVHQLGKMGTFAILFALPVLLLGAAVPVAAPVSDPIGWALMLWGVFLYWWAGALYLVQAIGLIRAIVPGQGDAVASASDTLDR